MEVPAVHLLASRLTPSFPPNYMRLNVLTFESKNKAKLLSRSAKGSMRRPGFEPGTSAEIHIGMGSRNENHSTIGAPYLLNSG